MPEGCLVQSDPTSSKLPQNVLMKMFEDSFLILIILTTLYGEDVEDISGLVRMELLRRAHPWENRVQVGRPRRVNLAALGRKSRRCTPAASGLSTQRYWLAPERSILLPAGGSSPHASAGHAAPTLQNRGNSMARGTFSPESVKCACRPISVTVY